MIVGLLHTTHHIHEHISSGVCWTPGMSISLCDLLFSITQLQAFSITLMCCSLFLVLNLMFQFYISFSSPSMSSIYIHNTSRCFNAKYISRRNSLLNDISFQSDVSGWCLYCFSDHHVSTLTLRMYKLVEIWYNIYTKLFQYTRRDRSYPHKLSKLVSSLQHGCLITSIYCKTMVAEI